MPRMNTRRYEQQLMPTMVVYMVLLFATGPLLHAARSLPLKVLLALLPVLPILYVIALMWRRIRDSDELEQRTNLVALGVATAVVSAASLVGGFLSAGGVLQLKGDILIWVFPALMASYGISYRLVARRYGVDSVCAEDGSAWLPWYFGAFGMAFLLFASYLWNRHETGAALAAAITAVFFAGMGGWVGWRRSRARRRAAEERR